jgi:hypothetical protein
MQSQFDSSAIQNSIYFPISQNRLGLVLLYMYFKILLTSLAFYSENTWHFEIFPIINEASFNDVLISN